MRDVAQRAGVSMASVSRSLSGRRRVDPDIAARVRAAADELGYHVDSVGRSLRLRSTETMGLVVADLANPFFASLVTALDDALVERGIGLLLADSANDVDRERNAVGRLLARRVDALFVTPVSRKGSRSTVMAAASRCPVVQLDRRSSRRVPEVGMDNAGAIRDVLAHLAASGRRRPAFIGSSREISTSWERERAFLSVSVDRGTPRVVAGNFSLDWGRVATQQVMRRWRATDALVCADDLIAVGAIEQLRQLGRRVPDDVAVVGFDDTMIARLQTPQITSVRQPLEAMARAAVDYVLAEGAATRAGRQRFSGELVLRASSSCGNVGNRLPT
jgi:LacI family transcriptional regulator